MEVTEGHQIFEDLVGHLGLMAVLLSRNLATFLNVFPSLLDLAEVGVGYIAGSCLKPEAQHITLVGSHTFI